MPDLSNAGFRSTTIGPLTVRVYDDRVVILRWYTVDGEPGRLGQEVSMTPEIAQRLASTLERMVGA